MTYETHCNIQNKSLHKENGVYSYKNYKYLVKDNKFLFFCDFNGNIFQIKGNFHVRIMDIESQNDFSKIAKQNKWF